MVSLQGQKAGATGSHMEETFLNGLSRKHYRCLSEPNRKLVNTRKDLAVFLSCTNGFPTYGTQLKVIESVYGQPFSVDFVIYHPDKWPKGLLIESKYQEKAGSVDQKFPYVFDTFREAGHPALIACGGNGATAPAKNYLVNRSKAHNSISGVAPIWVLIDMNEMFRWMNNEL